MTAADHPHTDPGDGRQQCETCGKWVWLVTHSCKGVRVAPADDDPAADPAVESILRSLPENFWDACTWVGSNFVHGTIDPADRKRIVQALVADHTPSPATDDQVYCCVACRAEGWACPALCQRPCCGAEIAATQNEACACGHARFMHGDTTGDTGCRGCRCESWRPEPPSPLDDLCCNGEGCSRCATPSPATDGLREAVEALRAEMVGLMAAGASLVGRGWIIHRCDQILAAHPAPPSETATVEETQP